MTMLTLPSDMGGSLVKWTPQNSWSVLRSTAGEEADHQHLFRAAPGDGLCVRRCWVGNAPLVGGQEELAGLEGRLALAARGVEDACADPGEDQLDALLRRRLPVEEGPVGIGMPRRPGQDLRQRSPQQ